MPMQPQIERPEISLLQTAGLLFAGLKLALSKPCRLYVIIPICVNLIIFSVLTWLSVNYLTELITSLTGPLPGFLEAIISTILYFTLIVAGCFLFSTVATIIASPFYGLLAEKVELLETGRRPNDDTLFDVIKQTPRIIAREIHKQMFFLPRAFICLIVLCIPVVNVIAPLLWFLLTAWMGCLQYTDYAYDNNKISFKDMRRELNRHRLPSFILGAVITFLLTIPILNLLVPPAAVCAGTKYYLRLQQAYTLAGGK